ncbi:hypothetical protein Taro_005956 [Colocasia esculenta]|uniref:Uncharacterized protein n=1 Tax=Colocasia esculenta TaxID=4460 RepID=A0A843TZD6_COLES|nr:hypothetical protein [Colocasia esculenta]
MQMVSPGNQTDKKTFHTTWMLLSGNPNPSAPPRRLCPSAITPPTGPNPRKSWVALPLIPHASCATVPCILCCKGGKFAGLLLCSGCGGIGELTILPGWKVDSGSMVTAAGMELAEASTNGVAPLRWSWPVKPRNSMWEMASSLTFAPISAAFCSRAVADMQADPAVT